MTNFFDSASFSELSNLIKLFEPIKSALLSISLQLIVIRCLPDLQIGTLFKVARTLDVPEPLKLEILQAISFFHLRILDGVSTLLQLQGVGAAISKVTQSYTKNIAK